MPLLYKVVTTSSCSGRIAIFHGCAPSLPSYQKPPAMSSRSVAGAEALPTQVIPKVGCMCGGKTGSNMGFNYMGFTWDLLHIYCT